MPPSPANSVAMAWLRSATTRAASSNDNAPATQAAAISPCECPTTASGTTPTDAHTAARAHHHRETRRLEHIHPLHQLRIRITPQHVHQRPVHPPLQRGRTLSDPLGEHRRRIQQFPAHPDPLRTLTREHPHDLARPTRRTPGHHTRRRSHRAPAPAGRPTPPRPSPPRPPHGHPTAHDPTPTPRPHPPTTPRRHPLHERRQPPRLTHQRAGAPRRHHQRHHAGGRRLIRGGLGPLRPVPLQGSGARSCR